jgi:hypothetical protein
LSFSSVGDTSVPSAVMSSTLRVFSNPSTPPTSWATTLSLRATAFAMSNRAFSTVMPCSALCVASQKAWLESRSAFEGMQPTVTQVPPTLSRSTSATFAPFSPA